jgi:hypothetical protein
MDDRNRDSRGASLIGELLLQLAQREGFRRKLAELEERGGPAFVQEIVDEFEKLIDRTYRQNAVEPVPPPKSSSSPEPKSAAPAAPLTPAPPQKAPREPEIIIPPPIAAEPSPFAEAFSSSIKDDYTIELPPLDLKPPADKEAVTAGREETPPPTKAPAPPWAPKRPPAETPAPPPVPKRPAQETPVVPSVPKRPPAETPAPPPVPKRPAQETPVVPSVPKRPPAETPLPPPVPKRPAQEPPKSRSTEPPPAPPAMPRSTEPAPPQRAESAPPSKPAGTPKTVMMRAVQIIEDQEILYFHAASQIPLEEKPAQKPFVMEEKGIESKGCTFALDRGGIRFYLSRVTGRSMNVSKTGVLLLSKQDSLRLRGTHYSILNDLRAHGILLPFVFGTVAMGKDALYTKIDEALYDLRDALEEMLSTKWWNLGVYVLDAKMAQSMASDSPGELSQRDRRIQGTRQPMAGRLDIKTLERILGKQKKIAEGIHGDLKELAVRSDVDMMVGLNSGSSDDWKPILRASYEVPLSSVSQFNRAVIDMQYRHFQYDLMFVLNGDGEEFSFNEG